MSGNAECAWAVAEKERIIDICEQFARKVGWKKTGKGFIQKSSLLIF